MVNFEFFWSAREPSIVHCTGGVRGRDESRALVGAEAEPKHEHLFLLRLRPAPAIASSCTATVTAS